MKHRTIISGFLLGIFLSSCQAQPFKQDGENTNIIKPKHNYSVNKTYDKEGNLIAYDSTYTYSYSTFEDDTLMPDTLLNSFRKQFNESYFFSEDPFFSDFYFDDSFMPNDFFTRRFRENMRQMDALFQGMDSIKNEFFRQNFGEANKP
jgi:hypothetical protein